MIFIFIGGSIALAVMTKDGETGGAITYHFALVSYKAKSC
jgi:hypothetical protein